MATVRRSNVILQIADEPDLVQKYKDKGFDIIDNETGEIIEKAISTDVGSLQAYIIELENKLKEAEAEIEVLQKKSTQTTAKKVTKKSE